ncbi:hypothetical protein CLCR_09254 [Cladophialophora carrionii]|uniref:Uncharacterized protein n=1 Tax=Cladophialophora carrionii TaxID=86049 RepID=A0A1C1CT63_9EURO|nr:hypothetical protein CLCR_09254 [Cladophialophora carrionii]
MDGDHTGKNLDAGANAATKAQDLTEGIHEGAAQGAAAGAKTTGQGTSMFSKDGAVGHQFTGAGQFGRSADSAMVNRRAGMRELTNDPTYTGAIGGAGNKVGGPLAEDGMIGKNFTP